MKRFGYLLRGLFYAVASLCLVLAAWHVIDFENRTNVKLAELGADVAANKALFIKVEGTMSDFLHAIDRVLGINRPPYVQDMLNPARPSKGD